MFVEVDLCTANIVSLSSTENDTRSESNNSDSSFAIKEHDNNIPNSLKWSTSDVIEYFENKLPQEVIDRLTNLVRYY